MRKFSKGFHWEEIDYRPLPSQRVATEGGLILSSRSYEFNNTNGNSGTWKRELRPTTTHQSSFAADQRSGMWGSSL
jgi:hypothetical protein